MRNSWVIYLDILGFRALVRSASEAGTANELLINLTAALEQAKVSSSLDPEGHSHYGLEEAPYAVKMFTDNVVLGFPIHDDGESEFGRMIYIVGLWQYALLQHGFFVRGGMAVGPVYMDDDVVFGKGLLDAYDAETTLARDPRVVLAPSAVDLIHHHLAYYANMSETPHNSSLLVDADSQLFVNYLYLPVDGAEELPDEFALGVERHRNHIIDRLQRSTGTPAIWSKYAWVGAYHNHFCSHYAGLGHLKVDLALLAQAPRFIGQIYAKKGNKVLREGIEVATKKTIWEWPVEKEPE
jgi:hypothetical protein